MKGTSRLVWHQSSLPRAVLSLSTSAQTQPLEVSRQAAADACHGGALVLAPDACSAQD